MKRWAGVVLVALLAGVATPALRAATPPPKPSLPPGLPPAAYVPEPVLPPAAGWGLPDAFPRTSGTGRLAHGAVYWSDFLYDDHGAVGNPAAGQAAYGTYTTPSGSYTYPDGPDANNGADIFRVAIARVKGGTRWRVDWNTLANPIAAFYLDTKPGGVDHWAGLLDLTVPGTDRMLVVDARGAWVEDERGTILAELPTAVDAYARSFVVDVPDAALRPTGHWNVRMVAGRAHPTGRGFAAVSLEDGAFDGQPPVYNVAFRTNDQEPVGGWREAAQAKALQDGDITPFVLPLDWDRLTRKEVTPAEAPRGVSEHWYVSAKEFGRGVLLSSEQVRAKFLGRVQPYSVYVPKELDLRQPVALTWLLHSFSTNHTQYEDKPELLRHLCDERGSICVTPLGRGPDGFNVVEAELDFWELWNRVGRATPIDWSRTTVWGYSMGAIGVYRLASTYPDLFARAALVAGGSGGGGVRPFPGGPDLGAPTPDVNTTPLLGNLRGVPIFIAQGALDELNPLPGSLDPPNELDRLGYRYKWLLHPAEDHVVLALKDGFADSAAYLGHARRSDPCPRQVDYTWIPTWDRPDLGVGTVGAYWIRNLVAGRSGPGVTASVHAVSGFLVRPEPVLQRSAEVGDADPSPAIRRELTWRDGPLTPRTPELTLQLRNVAHVTVAAGCAGLDRGTITIDTDLPTIVDIAGRRVRTITAPPGRTSFES